VTEQPSFDRSLADDLAAQREDLATLRRELAALRQPPAPPEKPTRRRRRGVSQRWASIAMVAFLLALVPAAIGASNRFDDVPDGAFYHDDATAIADANVTRGCDENNYCPNRDVTRGEMASFLARLGGLGNNPPVANAATAQTVPDGSITTAKLANGAVTPAKLSATGSTAGQVLTSTGTGVAFQTFTAGGQGPAGPPGQTGPTGRPGPASIRIVTATVVVDNVGPADSVTVPCAAGEVVTGGGFSAPASNTDFVVLQSYPSSTAAWTFTGIAFFAGSSFTVTAYAVCAPGATP